VVWTIVDPEGFRRAIEHGYPYELRRQQQ